MRVTKKDLIEGLNHYMNIAQLTFAESKAELYRDYKLSEDEFSTIINGRSC